MALTVNCDTAQKMVKQLQTEVDSLLWLEKERRTYSYIAGEEPVIPEYDFTDNTQKIWELNVKISKLKHAINVFNTTTYLPYSARWDKYGGEITIDMALVILAMDSNQKHKLEMMRIGKKMDRRTVASGVSEYTVLNYDPYTAKCVYDDTCEEITLLQQEISTLNMTKVFEVDI